MSEAAGAGPAPGAAQSHDAARAIAARLSAMLQHDHILVPIAAVSEALESIAHIDLALLASEIMKRRTATAGISIITSDELRSIAQSLRAEKVPLPMPVEVQRSYGARPAAMEYHAEYKINGRQSHRVSGTVEDFVHYFRSRLERLRAMLARRESTAGIVSRLDSISGYMDGRSVGVAGMVSSKSITKNGNLMLVLEDEYAEARVIFMNWQGEKQRSIFQSASMALNDEVIAVRGHMYHGMVMADDVLFPDVPMTQMPAVEEEIAIAFVSDLHIGSKLFMEDRFMHMLNWLGGASSADRDGPGGLAGKIKYIVIAGDVADGVGVYPNQERELSITDIYGQYRVFTSLLESIPDYIHVFVAPGNHDAVRLAEPQPRLGEELVGECGMDNVHFIDNPCHMTLHGIDVLAYHGASLDPIIASVPGMSYSAPEKAMVEALKRRHLSPIYGSNPILPTQEDTLVIDRVPHILNMGHEHRCGIASYHGVYAVNSGTWQSRTQYQVSLGHVPTPCIMPVYDARKCAFTMVNFNSVVA